ncbi:MAG: Ni/Fe hydrogenase subunit alpha [Phycisphaerales bacterium]|nr:Ni/Fe hydrogenase subunit alpha [Phycisphaerales bacterium]
MKNFTIDVKHITRVEGHGNITVRVRDGEITHLELAIVESPRFFEAFLRGRPYHEAPHITCRICGICSVGHTMASVRGIEAACGIVPSEQTVLLRKLILFGEHIQSHVLHLYFLAVPDFLGAGSVIPLARTHPTVVQRALRMKKLANDLCAVVGGRHIHPIAMQVGGCSHVPREGELQDIRKRLVDCREDLDETVGLFAELKFPQLNRPTEYVALKHANNGEYALYDGDIVSSHASQVTSPQAYRSRVLETVVPHSAAKHCASPYSHEYAVGALARFNNNAEQLHPAAKAVAAQLGFTAPNTNPFYNNTAQLVEVVHDVESSIELIDTLLAQPLELEPIVPPRDFGIGVGATEVPRGLLFHEYALDKDGNIEGSNLIIPTGQNLANIEADMRAFVPQLMSAGMGKEEMTLHLEMLVRAYDPCISCATHFLDIQWED